MSDTDAGSSCCSSSCCGGSASTQTTVTEPPAKTSVRDRLNVELLVLDLDSCTRCVPTSGQLRGALELIAPVAEALGVGLTYRETVVQSAAEAKARALLTSPTIRINGRDIAQDIRESECESCGDLTEGGVNVDCREWHYRGKVYSAAPLPLLLEALMSEMLLVDERPVVTPEPIDELPDNLDRYFANMKPAAGSCCC